MSGPVRSTLVSYRARCWCRARWRRAVGTVDAVLARLNGLRGALVGQLAPRLKGDASEQTGDRWGTEKIRIQGDLEGGSRQREADDGNAGRCGTVARSIKAANAVIVTGCGSDSVGTIGSFTIHRWLLTVGRADIRRLKRQLVVPASKRGHSARTFGPAYQAEIAVSAAIRSGLLLTPAASARLLRAGARRRRRHEPSVHGGGRDRTRRARHRDLALPVPLHGAGQQAARSAEGRARGGPRRRGRGGAAPAEAAALCRRQVVRRAHDLAGAGARTAARRARPGVPRLSAPSRRQAVARARQASVRRARSRCCSCRARATRSRRLDELEPLCAALGRARDAQAVRRRRSFLPRAGAHAAARMRRCAPRCSTRSPPGSTASSLTLARRGFPPSQPAC